MTSAMSMTAKLKSAISWLLLSWALGLAAKEEKMSLALALADHVKRVVPDALAK